MLGGFLGPIGFPELVLILLVVLIVFGAGRLPEIGEGLGKGIRSFKRALSDEEHKPISPATQAEEKKDVPPGENKDTKP